MVSGSTSTPTRVSTVMSEWKIRDQKSQKNKYSNNSWSLRQKLYTKINLNELSTGEKETRLVNTTLISARQRHKFIRDDTAVTWSCTLSHCRMFSCYVLQVQSWSVFSVTFLYLTYTLQRLVDAIFILVSKKMYFVSKKIFFYPCI